MGDSTPVIEVLGLVLIMFAFVLIIVLVLPNYLKVFVTYFLRSSAEAVARDIASLSSLSLASYKTTMEYEVKTETASYSVSVTSQSYLKVNRLDNSFCKEEKYKKDEFCESMYPVIYRKEMTLLENGKKFVIQKDDKDNVKISVKE
ncbi:MAG: hypothetical protein J7K98_00850 [Candidatus Aenigmarchaeota archaeon]|nr:hypothetical protein [Candidatus Aenigmarchaeota archaeon]